MGLLRFALHPPQLADERPELRHAYISGIDRMPWRTRVELADGLLACWRGVPESGVLNVPWPVEGFGQVMLKTATLRERQEPYHFQVELARGKVNQLRNQVAEWEMAGLRIPDGLRGELREVHHTLARALTSQSQPDRAARMAENALAQVLWIAERFTELYTEQVFEARHRQYPQLNTLLGAAVGHDTAAAFAAPAFTQAFNSVAVRLAWKDVEPSEGEYCWEPFDELVEWCLKHRLVVIGGPLVEWSPHALPDWLWLWEGDFSNLLSFMSDFIETVIARYRGRIRLWEVASRTNCGDALSLDEEQRLRLTVRALRVARERDAEAGFLITLGQPWAEYMARREYQYSPLHFADALVRADLGLNALGLELAFGYEQGGSFCRDLLDVSALLDHYAMLGVPLHVSIAAPSAQGLDEQATTSWQFGGGSWHGGWTEDTQADWIDAVLRLTACKPYVQAVRYAHFSDAARHELPLAGLVRGDGTPKPALERVIAFHKQHLR